MLNMKPSILSLLTVGFALAEPRRVLDHNFPDPAVIQTEQGYYAFGTQSDGINVQVARSDDFNTWTLLEGTDALPGPFPSWVQGDNPLVWAPDVIQLDDGTYVLYFSGLAREDNAKHCVGTATSPSITGPYTPSESPFACHLDQGGAIDAVGYHDPSGKRYVIYKVDGNSLNGNGPYHPTPLLLQEVEADGITKVGSPIQILDRDDADGPLVEGPSLIKVDGTYYLTFSSNMYNTLAYDVSYATAEAITGPYTKAQAPDAPLLVSGDGSDVGPLAGPGHGDFLDGGRKFIFHAFRDGQSIDSGRGAWVVDVEIGGGKITLL
ncbi:glycosyl hydrolase [Aspergillus karnatakaensis]|uniref:glycoside hydrolase family 43 protein n=1 Tax=Aspergillus karnatakaensis TaxID=1810916 RepID=UPI003CCCA685